ncbi:hypothetical protein [Burkholderia seminalis]|uniref:hypothetical protein n=1 Tax=Burkholderia seminalis TaxID=488731 RepID=UPI001906BB76|nr:hypothetical protein [Burkholderia seminalis]MBJ9593209.1 hypothetical protein [Burkholderia seminalis]
MNCKPGDLAYVTSGKEAGSVVQVLRPWGEFPRLGHLWTVEFSHDVATVVPSFFSIDGFRKSGETKRVLQCPDDWLRPIGGVPVTDDIEDEVTA